jgi:DNA-binding XRE family transcriptional regulator
MRSVQDAERRNLQKTMGRNFKAIRIARGLSNSEISTQANVDRANLHNMEAGRRAGSLAGLLRVAKVLGVSLDDLVREDGLGAQKWTRKAPRDLPVGTRVMVVLNDGQGVVFTTTKAVPVAYNSTQVSVQVHGIATEGGYDLSRVFVEAR